MTRRRMVPARCSTILLLLALGGIGCGDDDGGGPRPTPTPTASPTPTPRPAQFVALPFSNDNFANCVANGISDDGTVVVGQCVNEENEFEPVRWVNGVVERLGFPSPQPDVTVNAFAYAVSDSGVITGNEGILDLTPLAYYYASGAWHPIEDATAGAVAQAPWAISSDGSVLVGGAAVDGADLPPRQRGTGFIFRPATGSMATVPTNFTAECSGDANTCVTELLAVDATGATAVGSDAYYPDDLTQPPLQVPIVYAIGAGEPARQLPLEGYRNGIAQTISRNGRVVAGAVGNDDATSVGVYWTLAAEEPVYIGSLGSGDTSSFGVSNAGVVVGYSNEMAFLYYRDAEGIGVMRSLQEYLVSVGLENELEGWDLWVARAITPDGKRICGFGEHDGYRRAFVAQLPVLR